MGEVWKARDSQLGRSVAIKVLPAELAADASLRIRLAREAKAISALNDPHICTLHDVGEADGLDYLVMEYCEGRTLADRILVGPIPLDEALQHGIEIAEALSRAHRAGIIHRDLKPSNVMITRSGVKLLDFGLAERREQRAGGEGVTSSLHASERTITGTTAYMAPEILAGREADARADLFAFGAVLYEMLGGRRAFEGASKANVIAAILEKEPKPLREIAPAVPAALEHLIERCLAKDRDARCESAHDVAEQLRWIRSAKAPPLPRRRRPFLAFSIGALALAGALAVAAWRMPRSEALRTPLRLSISLSEAGAGGERATIFGQHLTGNVAISPDGTRVAYTAQRGGELRLFVRRLDEYKSVELAGTENAAGPFFSPDGASIGFITGAGMMKIRPGGGAPEMISREMRGNSRGAVWAPDGWIYYTPHASSGLKKVSATGGASIDVTNPDAVPGESGHRWPALLPGGKQLLFTIRTDEIESFDQAKIAVLDLKTGTRRIVFEGGSRARYLPPGYLLFARAGALHVVPFDLKTLTVRGPSRKVVDGVASGSAGITTEFDVSRSGDLVFIPGALPDPKSDLLTITRSGEATVAATIPFAAVRPEVSPDGRTIALNGFFANDDIYLFDIESGVANRFSFERGDETNAVWTPDGQNLIYNSFRPPRLLMRRADGAGVPVELFRGVAPVPDSCSRDGELLFSDRSIETGWDLWLLPLGGDRRPRALLRTPFNEYGARFSPDGGWVLYVSDESGSAEIFLRPAEPGGARWQISTAGGFAPRWSADGSEVFYRRGDEIFSVAVSASGRGVRTGKPERLFSVETRSTNDFYTIAGDRFLMTRFHSWDQPRPAQINVVLGWTRELER